MNIKLIFNKKLREENRLFSSYNIPDYMLTIDLLNLIPDSSLRQLVYEVYSNETKDNFSNFIEIYKLNTDVAIDFLTSKRVLNNELYDQIKEISKYGFDTMYLTNDELRKNIFKIKNKYGNEILPYLKQNYELYNKVLNLSFSDELNKDIIIKYPNEVLSLEKMNGSQRAILIPILNDNNLDNYQNIKLAVTSIKDEYLLAFLKYCNFNNEYVELLNNKKITNKFEFLALANAPTYYYNEKFDSFLNQYIDWSISNELNQKNIQVDNVKSFILMKYYGLSILKLESWINKLENSGINLDENQTNTFKNIVNFLNLTNINEVMSYFQNQNSNKRYEFGKLMDNLWKDDLKNIIFNPNNIEDNKKSKEIEYGDKKIKVLDSDITDLTKINMFVHLVSDRKSNFSPNGELSSKLIDNPSLWTGGQGTFGGSDFISCSIISENHMSTFGNPIDPCVILGFSGFDNTFVSSVYNCDARTKMGGSAFDFSNSNEDWTDFVDFPSSLCNDYDRQPDVSNYNEIAIGRRENGAVKLPSYVLSIKNFPYNLCRPIDENAKKWASYYNIPIVVVDGDVIYKAATDNFTKELDELNNPSEPISLSDFNKMLKSIRTIETVKGNRFNIYNLLIKVIETNNKLGLPESTNYNLEILSEYGKNDKSKYFVENDLMEQNESNDKLREDRIQIIEEYLKSLKAGNELLTDNEKDEYTSVTI